MSILQSSKEVSGQGEPERQEGTRDESEMEQGPRGQWGEDFREQPGEEREPFPAAQAKERSACEAQSPSQLWWETEVCRAVTAIPPPTLVPGD